MLASQRLSFGEYANRFVGPISSVWRIEKVDAGYVVHFPNHGSREVRVGSVDWAEQFSEDNVTSTLWFQSLTYAPYFLIDHDDWDMTAYMFSSYASHLRAARSGSDFQPINSLDHAHAAQLMAVSATMAVVSKDEPSPDKQAVLVDFMEAVADSALSPGMIKQNNHGVMLTRALAHAGSVFDGVTNTARECALRGAREFDAIVAGAFDDQGIVNENTPAYQILWMRLIETMANFTELVGDPYGFVSKWRELLGRAKGSLGLQLMSDNRVPPIGDDAGGVSPYPSVNGELLSEANGIYVFKDADLYLSIISGYRGVVHKHLDDTSIRLQYGGQDLLIDGGLLNYDVNDAVGISVVSQRGHTGLYFPKFDHLRPLDVFAVNPPRQSSEMKVGESPDGARVFDCTYVFDGVYRASRRYTRYGNEVFLIEDSFSAPGGESALQRFLLPKEANLSFEAPTLRASFEGVDLILRFDPASELRVFNGSDGPLPKGWRAARQYERDRCWCIEVAPSAGATTLRASLAVVPRGSAAAHTDALDRFWSTGSVTSSERAEPHPTPPVAGLPR